jgi:hypothetical protein
MRFILVDVGRNCKGSIVDYFKTKHLPGGTKKYHKNRSLGIHFCIEVKWVTTAGFHIIQLNQTSFILSVHHASEVGFHACALLLE